MVSLEKWRKASQCTEHRLAEAVDEDLKIGIATKAAPKGDLLYNHLIFNPAKSIDYSDLRAEITELYRARRIPAVLVDMDAGAFGISKEQANEKKNKATTRTSVGTKARARMSNATRAAQTWARLVATCSAKVVVATNHDSGNLQILRQEMSEPT